MSLEPANPAVSLLGLEGAGLLAALHAASFERGWSEAEIRDLLASPGVRAVVMSEEGEPAGFALIRAIAGEAELLTLCVRPQFRRTGLGEALLQSAETTAAAQGAQRLFLEVSAANEAAIGLYSRAGYRTSGRRKGYYRDGSDAVLMDKPLG